MVSEKDKNVYQLAHYFVMNYDYKFVEVPGQRHEIWLGSVHAQTYPIIRITSAPISSTFFDKPRMFENHAAISKFLNVNAKLLDIHINDDEIESFEDDMIQVAIKDNQLVGANIATEFPTILKFAEQDKSNLSAEEKLKAMTPNQQKKKGLKSQLTVTNCIAILCIGVFIVANYIQSMMGGGAEQSVNAAIIVGAYYKAFVVAGGEYFRFLTAGFVHVEIIHLMMNMMALLSLGRVLEKVYTRKQYLAILLCSIITGSTFVFIAQHNLVVYGLSGGLYGLLGALVVFAYDSKAIQNPGVARGLLTTFALNIMISFLPGISLYGHLGGFIGGFFLALYFTHNDSWKVLKRNAFISLSVLVVFMGYRATQSFEITPIYYKTDLMVLNFYQQIGLESYSQHMNKKLVSFYGFKID